MSASSLPYVCSKKEVGQEANKTILDLPKKEGVELFTIDGYPVYE